MIPYRSAGRRLLTCAFVFLALGASAASARASSFQLVMNFDTEIVGTEAFTFAFETQVLGVWVEIPCVGDIGSCTRQFTDVPAGTAIVLADTSMSFFTSGTYYLKVTAPPRWEVDRVTFSGTESHREESLAPGVHEVYFSFDLGKLEDEGRVTLHNVGPEYPPSGSVPEPATLALVGLAVTITGLRLPRRR